MQAKIFQLLDVIAVEVAAHRVETAKQGVDLRAELRGEVSELRTEMHAGFNRVDHRLGNVETRVENIETRVENIETNVAGLGADLRSFRGEFERRVSPLER
jgi:hypothetical protein